MVKKLEWDSNFFGYQVGLKTINSIDEFQLNPLLEELKKFKLIYVFSDVALPKNSKLNHVDTKVDFYKFLENDFEVIETEEFDLRIHSYEELLNLAYLSGNVSRFKVDSKFSNSEFEKLYKEWINNSINNKIAFKTLIKTVEEKVVGFVTLGEKDPVTSKIGLIAVNEMFQGKRIASKLIKSCEIISKQNKYKGLEVSTQFSNNQAMAFYKNNDFEINKITYIYHLWNYDTI
jgi:dTDP-4-amino-4,6-dideoxy-D-galactose acyltransferase